MNDFLILAFLFFIGCVAGWCLEVVYRRFAPANTSRKWINPGFLNGPWLPLYGFGLCCLYLLAGLEGTAVMRHVTVGNKLILFVVMALVMTLLEYIAGLIFIKGMNIKLWDYSNRWGNIQGIICPLFSLIWLAVGALYYFVIDPFVIGWVEWFVSNMSFAFVVGFFFGVFTIDFCHSINLTVKIRKFATDHDVVVRYEKVKESIKESFDKLKNGVKDTANKIPKARFFSPFKSSNSLEQALIEYLAKENAEKEKPRKRWKNFGKKEKNCKRSEEK